jgi:hypothetical protein
VTETAERVRAFLSFYRLSAIYACVCLTVIGVLVAKAPGRNADAAVDRGVQPCSTAAP